MPSQMFAQLLTRHLCTAIIMAKVSQASLVEHKQLAVLVRELFPETSSFLLSWNCLFQHWERMSLSTMGEGSAAGIAGMHPAFWTCTLCTGVSLTEEWHEADNSRRPRPKLWLKQNRDVGLYCQAAPCWCWLGKWGLAQSCLQDSTFTPSRSIVEVMITCWAACSNSGTPLRLSP